MKLLVLISLLSVSAFAGVCSKDVTVKEVNRVCDAIKKDGAKAKSVNLVFENCGKNYVWIQDAAVETMNMVVHPIKRRLNGKALNKHVDEDGVKLFVEFDKGAKANAEGAWVDYKWAKPGAEKATPKTSFVRLCEGAGSKWIAGSGVWKEDL